MNWRRLLSHLLAFFVGCSAVMIPMFIQASWIHAEETARHEQTMSPGITMFLGLVFAPLGGITAILLLQLLFWRLDRRRHRPHPK